MPFDAYYCQCDCCSAAPSWVADKDGHELHLCGHHAAANRDALEAAGFTVNPIRTAATAPA